MARLFVRSALGVALIVFPLPLHAAEWNRAPSDQVRLNQGKVKPAFTNSIRQKGGALYKALMGIKKERDFINNGYGSSSSKARYQMWDADVTALHAECSGELQKLKLPDRIESELFDVCVATTNLSQLGMHYAMNGAVEDRSTKMWRTAIKSAFKIR